MVKAKVEDQITIAGITGVPTGIEPYNGPSGMADNITSSDLRLPRVALLQALSPQVQNDGGKYKQGMFIDTLTQDVLPSTVVFTPVFVFKNVIKWKPRNEGGGMIWKTTNPTPEQLADTQWNGDKKPVADVYINAVVLIKGSTTPMILSFCKTSLKAGQDLATLCFLSKPCWKYSYNLDAVKVSNTKGTFYVMRVTRGSLNDSNQVIEASELFEQVKGMAIDTDYEGSTHSDNASTEPTEF